MDDCLIAGAGIVGLSLAYELAGCGQRVQVVDRGGAGREASWAGAGILPPANPRTAVHPLDQLRGWSHQLYPQWSQALREETGIDNGYRRCGGIHLARSEAQAAALAELVRQYRSQQLEIVPLAGDGLSQLEPALAPVVASGAIRAAWLAPDEAQLRNPRHLQALAAACRARGVRITEGVTIRGFETAGDRVRSAETTAGPLLADNFVVAAGAWSRQLLSRLGVTTGIRPIRGQMILFRCQRPPLQRIINEGSRYLVARDDGRVLVGSSEEDAGFDKSTTEDVLLELRQLAVELVPELRQAPIEATWSGLRPGSPDGMPYLGRIPGLENAYAAAGHYRSGLHLSPATAMVLRQLILGEVPEVDLAPLAVGRDEAATPTDPVRPA